MLHKWAIIVNIALYSCLENMEIKISDELNSIIRYAREEAMRTGSYGIGPDHLFLGMMRQADNDACKVLSALGVDADAFKRFIDSHIFTNESIPYSEADKICPERPEYHSDGGLKDELR